MITATITMWNITIMPKSFPVPLTYPSLKPLANTDLPSVGFLGFFKFSRILLRVIRVILYISSLYLFVEDDIPFYEYTMNRFCVYYLEDIWVVPSLWLL